MRKWLCLFAAMMLCLAASFTGAQADDEAIVEAAWVDLIASGDWGYVLLGDEAVVRAYYGAESSIAIPAQIDGHKVTRVSGSSAPSGGYVSIAGLNREQLEEVAIPSGVRFVEDGAFIGCSKLTSVTLAASVTLIGRSAFEGTALKSIDLCCVQEIAMDAFLYCESLSEVTFGSQLKTIDMRAFAMCAELKQAAFPDSLEKIGRQAFYGAGLTEVTLPQKTIVDGFAFSEGVPVNGVKTEAPERGQTNDGYSYELYRQGGYVRITQYSGNEKELIIPDEIEGLPVVSVGRIADDDVERVVFPDSVTQIEPFILNSQQKLREIVLSKSLTYIPSNAFSYCTSLESIEIPEGVTQIGEAAFDQCAALSSVTIPQTVKTIENRAFKGTNLRGVVLPPLCKVGISAFDAYAVVDEDLDDTPVPGTLPNGLGYVLLYAEGYAVINEYRGEETELVIPAEIEGLPVTMVETLNMYSTPVERIVLPDSVTEIDMSTFMFMGLREIELSPNLTIIPEYAFSKCSKLEHIKIPEGVTEIKSEAFSGCTSLASVTLPQSLRRIGAHAFTDCPSLTEITVPEACTVAAGAFDAATEIKRQ